jgi:hypothetical protein
VRRATESDDFVLLRSRDGVGPNLSLDQVHSTVQVPPRIHLDLYTENQAGEVARSKIPTSVANLPTSPFVEIAIRQCIP